MTEPDASPSEGAASLRTIRRRLVVLLAVALVLGLAAAGVVVARSGRQPPPSTTKAVPVDVSCVTATYCVVVDDLGRAITYHDGAWSTPTHIDTNGLNTVSCPTTTFCLAADDNGAVVRTVGQGRWSAPRAIDDLSVGKVSQDGLSSITVVSCATPDFCMAGDVLGRVNAFHGRKRTPFAPIEHLVKTRLSLEKAVTGLDCVTTTFCAAVTDRGQALVWEGEGWMAGHELVSLSAAYTAQARLRSTIADVSCTSSSFCVAVNPTGVAYTYDGTSWSSGTVMDRGATAAGDGVGVTAVSCAARTCVAVDDSGKVARYDGTSWSAPRLVDPTLGLATVSCATPTFCVALNDIGEALLYNGSTWSAPRTVDH